MNSCFMFGNRDCPESSLPKIEKTIEQFYLKNKITTFYVGNRGNFDRLAAVAVKHMKRHYPEIKLYLVLAYHPAERPVYLSEGFDNSYYPPLENVPRPYAIVRGNRYMVSHCDSIICYVNHFGNTRSLLEYAQRQQKRNGIILENLAQSDM